MNYRTYRILKTDMEPRLSDTQVSVYDVILTHDALDRVLVDRGYCERCAEQLAEVVMDLKDRYLGVTHLYFS